MKYRETEYRILQMVTPPGWRWTVLSGDTVAKCGIAKSQVSARAEVVKFIDRLFAVPNKKSAIKPASPRRNRWNKIPCRARVEETSLNLGAQPQSFD